MNAPIRELLLRTFHEGDGSAIGVAPAARIDPAPALTRAAPDGMALRKPVAPSPDGRLARTIPLPVRVAQAPAGGSVRLSPGLAEAVAAADASLFQDVPQAGTAVPGGAPHQALAALISAGLPVPRLSSTARMISALMDEATATPPDCAVRPARPLVANAGGATPLLARALQRSLSDSGLFYESHLAQWALQQWRAPDLLREPQAAWNGAWLAATSADDARGATPTERSAGDVATGMVEHLRAQLHTLETDSVRWQGDAWPGQRIELAIAADGRAAGSGAAPTQPWITRLALTLPTLGAVDLVLRVHGDAIDVAVAPQAAGSARWLDLGRAEFDRRLGARFRSATLSLDRHAR